MTESKVKLELKPALKKYGANVAVDVLEEKKNQLAADQQVVDRLAAENEELYEALKAIHPHSTGYMESMSWRVYNGALYKVNIAIANYKERHKEAH